jgi:nicotinate-nucleotide adenylyltransferase
MKRIGLFPGSFDPIHDGHIEVARAALEQLELDELYFMVEEKPWGDKKPVSLKHRIRMLQFGIINEPRMEILSKIDHHFTLDTTLPKLEAEFKECELYFIFGGDVFIHMNPDQWPELENLLRHYIVVFERGVISEKRISDHARNLGIVIAIIPSTLPLHSSTDVRLEAQNKAVWVPEKIATYIAEHNLYQ